MAKLIFLTRPTLLAVALVVTVFKVGQAVAQSTAWFGGGSNDGYDRFAAQQPFNVPYADNAGGASNMTPSSAWLNGRLASTGAAPTAVFVFWGPADGRTTMTDWAHTNDFGFQTEGAMLTTNVTGLAPHTRYSYRFFATNTAGESTWALESAHFTTPEVPIVANAGAAITGVYSAVLGGTLSAGITAAVTMVWGPDPDAWSDTNALGILAEGAFTRTVSGLSPASAYSCRFFASNEAGTAWSGLAGFTTTAVSTPTVTASGASRVDADSAVLNGTLAAGGGASITVYWGTNASAWSMTNALGNREAGAFAISVDGLQAATPYAYRCYAVSEAGTAWSETALFETMTAVSRFRGGNYDGFDALSLAAPMRSSSGVLLIIR